MESFHAYLVLSYTSVFWKVKIWGDKNEWCASKFSFVTLIWPTINLSTPTPRLILDHITQRALQRKSLSENIIHGYEATGLVSWFVAKFSESSLAPASLAPSLRPIGLAAVALTARSPNWIQTNLATQTCWLDWIMKCDGHGGSSFIILWYFCRADWVIIENPCSWYFFMTFLCHYG